MWRKEVVGLELPWVSAANVKKGKSFLSKHKLRDEAREDELPCGGASVGPPLQPILFKR